MCAMIRVTHLAIAIAVGLTVSTVAYRGLTMRTADSSNLSDGVRMTTQHAVVRYASGSGSASPVATTYASTSPPPPPLPPPPPPPPQASVSPLGSGTQPAAVPEWLQPSRTALAFNAAARSDLSGVVPRGTTLHFTFGSSVMMDFVKNWLHFVQRAGLSPYLVGAADVGLLRFCDEHRVPAAGIVPELDVWTYKKRSRAAGEVFEMKSEWKYFRCAACEKCPLSPAQPLM